ncbi:unnamed protein product, partial [marine sediment metagenome]
GYEPVERRKKQKKLEIGIIPIDAIFTPVKRVSFKVENMRVGERTDFDRLFLDIETDGTVTPEEVFFQSSEILIKHFSLLATAFKASKEKEVPEEKAPKKKPAPAKAAASKKAMTVKKKQKKPKKKSK